MQYFDCLVVLLFVVAALVDVSRLEVHSMKYLLCYFWMENSK